MIFFFFFHVSEIETRPMIVYQAGNTVVAGDREKKC